MFTNLEKVGDSRIVSSLASPYIEVVMVGRLTLFVNAAKVLGLSQELSHETIQTSAINMNSPCRLYPMSNCVDKNTS